MDVTEYLNSKSVKYERQGNEVLIHCPECYKQKLSINTATGIFQCWYCKAQNENSKYIKGHITKLQEEWGDIVNISTLSIPKQDSKPADFTELAEQLHADISKKALKYLFGRGINQESIDRFKLGYSYHKDQAWISIPSYEDGVCKLIKYRKLPPETNVDAAKNDREKGGESILFNQDVLKKCNEVFVCEGEIDAITLIQQGYENVVGITVGAGTLKPEWYDMFILMDKVYLIFDSDIPGQGSAENVWAKRLGLDRCWNILLPKDEDLNSFFQLDEREEFDKLVKSAYKFKVDGIFSIQEVLDKMYEKSQRDEDELYRLPWPSVNRLLGGGLQHKNLTVIGGQSYMGKTSLTMQIAYEFTNKYKIPSLFFCLEMPEEKLVTKVIQLDRNIAYEDVKACDALIYGLDLEDFPMYFGYSATITPEIYYNTVRAARDRYGCELFVFDNLQLLVVSDKESEYAAAVKMFKRVAMELDVMMLLVSQPRKLNSERRPTYDDLKGSASIGQGADEIILMHRKRVEGQTGFQSFESKTKIIVEKARFSTGGTCILELIGNKSRFEEIKKDEG